DYNTALGFNAGQNLSAAGFDNIYIGDTAGTLDNTGVSPGDESGVIRIGSIFSGGAACFINGIGQTFQPIGGTVFQVTVDTSTGQLGWDFGPNQRSAPVPRGASLPRSAPQTAARPQRAILNLQVQDLEIMIAQR